MINILVQSTDRVSTEETLGVAEYYVTTLMNAAMKLGPLLLFIVAGYFIFIKLPFFFFLRNMNITKKEFEQKLPADFQKDYTVDNYKDFQKRMKLLSPDKSSQKNQAKPNESAKREERRKEEKKTESKERRRDDRKEERREEPKREPKKPVKKEQTPEEIFELSPGQKLTKEELRKRYYELLKKNHPDRVASMGAEFKTLAEKNTKEINSAYDKLKSKAA